MKYIQKYSERKQVFSIKRVLKNQIINWTPWSKQLPEKSVLFLFFHNLYEDQVDQYRKTLFYVKKHYKFLTYSECVQKCRTGIDGRYACISSDDGFKNFLLATKLFDELEIKGMVFINPSIVGENNYEIIKKHCKDKLLSPAHEFLNWDDLKGIKRDGHEIGNHGFYHKNLLHLSKQELYDEIKISKELIEKYLGKVEHYAYTYGKREFINEKAINSIIESGHTSIGSAIRGQHTALINDSRELIMREQIEPWYPIKHVKYFIGE